MGVMSLAKWRENHGYNFSDEVIAAAGEQLVSTLHVGELAQFSSEEIVAAFSIHHFQKVWQVIDFLKVEHLWEGKNRPGVLSIAFYGKCCENAEAARELLKACLFTGPTLTEEKFQALCQAIRKAEALKGEEPEVLNKRNLPSVQDEQSALVDPDGSIEKLWEDQPTIGFTGKSYPGVVRAALVIYKTRYIDAEQLKACEEVWHLWLSVGPALIEATMQDFAEWIRKADAKEAVAA